MSRIGVPSSMSMPRTRSLLPSRESSSTTVSAMGFGRRGERVGGAVARLAEQVAVEARAVAPRDRVVAEQCDRAAQRHRAEKFVLEVCRVPEAKTRTLINHDGTVYNLAGRREPIVERRGVDERLERRARLPHRLHRAVELT